MRINALAVHIPFLKEIHGVAHNCARALLVSHILCRPWKLLVTAARYGRELMDGKLLTKSMAAFTWKALLRMLELLPA